MPRISFLTKFFRFKSTFSRALVDSDILDRCFYLVSCDNLTFSPVLGCRKFQNADFAAFFPFAICFLANVTNFSRNYVSTLEQAVGICSARRSVGRQALRFRVLLILDQEMCELRREDRAVWNISMCFLSALRRS